VDFHRPPPGVVDHVADEIHRSAEYRLRAHRAQHGIEAAVAQYACIAHGAVGFEAVVVHDINIVVVDINAGGEAVGRCVWPAIGCAIGGVVEPVMKPAHAVVRHHMAAAIDGNRVERAHAAALGEIRSIHPGRDAIPGEHRIEPLAAQHVVVGNVEVARTRPVRVHGRADVRELRTLHREPHRAGDVLHARFDGYARIAEGDAFEVVVLAAHEVEEHRVAVAVEDHLAIAGRNDRNGLLRSAFLRQIVGAVPGSAAAGGEA